MRNQTANFYYGSTEHKIAQLTQRMQLIEEIVLKKPKRNRVTEAQRFLLCYHIGLIDEFLQYSFPSQKQRTLFLSAMIDIDADNARKFLSEVGKKDKPLLLTEANYSFLAQFFGEIGLVKLQKEADKTLVEILNRKGK